MKNNFEHLSKISSSHARGGSSLHTPEPTPTPSTMDYEEEEQHEEMQAEPQAEAIEIDRERQMLRHPQEQKLRPHSILRYGTPHQNRYVL